MIKIIPNQSGMDFIADNTFHIEASALYKNIGDGIRTVEFIRIKENRALFIEAKTAFPNPDNPSEKNKARFHNEITEICEKFIHSLNLLSSIKLGVAEEERFGEFSIPQKVSLVFMLVIKNHKLEWCKPIKSKIEAELPSYR